MGGREFAGSEIMVVRVDREIAVNQANVNTISRTSFALSRISHLNCKLH